MFYLPRPRQGCKLIMIIRNFPSLLYSQARSGYIEQQPSLAQQSINTNSLPVSK